MRKRAIGWLAAVLLALVLPVAAEAQSLLFDYLGFDYESPDPIPAQFGEPGSGYVGLGTVPNLFLPLTFNTTNNEYTYVMDGLTVGNVTPIGTYLIIDYNGGQIRLYEDSRNTGTAADYGTNPPNLVAPPTFTDGLLYLQGTLSNFQFVVNTTNGNGSFNADLVITGGSQLNNFPLNQRNGWTFAGSTGNALNIPAGYAHQIDGQTFLGEPVTARNLSWGRLKSVYRSKP